MNPRERLRAYVDGHVTIKERRFVLESLEEDHQVLRDEDQMHTFIWFTSIKDVAEGQGAPPEIIMNPRVTPD